MGKRTYPVISQGVANRLIAAEQQQAAVLSFFRTTALAIYANLSAELLITDDGVVDSEGITDQLLEASMASQFAANIFMQTVGLPPVKIRYTPSEETEDDEVDDEVHTDEKSHIVLP